MAADVLGSFAEQRNQERELCAGDESRQKNGDRRDDRPSDHESGKPGGAERANKQPQRREAIAERERNGHRQRLDCAEHGERAHSRPHPSNRRVKETATTDPRERDRENQPECVRRAAEERRKEAIPHELHQKKRETDDRCGGVD